MIRFDKSLLARFYGKDLIAYGTGFIGQVVIPYLAQDPDVKLVGVTTSTINTFDAGVFPGTTLPMRSLRTWAEVMPSATILICSVVEKSIMEIYSICVDAGFPNIMICPLDLFNILYGSIDIEYRPTAHPALSLACLANEIHDIHSASFSEFKGCHRGETIAVVGCGPTLNYYNQIEGIPHVGVNRSFLKKDLSLNYYFLCHYIPELCDQLRNYNFVKFFADVRLRDYPDAIPDYAVEENHARRYFEGAPDREIHQNIEYYPLMGYYSIIFQAVHFSIYTRPKQILLIGCDCSQDGHFDGEPMNAITINSFLPQWLEGYRAIKKFVSRYYPDTEIISVNPVGLRGMFHDVYTGSYLDDHPELDRAECEILDPKQFKIN